jgi:lipopolysaccharide biosynthesis regulator YciM
MDATLVIVLGVFFLLIFIAVAGRSLFVAKQESRTPVDPLYVQALEAMARGEESMAIRFLRASIESNPSSVLPYLLLGDLLRKRGDLERSLKIHKELSVRPSLDKKLRLMVLKSLARDQLKLGSFPDAVSGCKEMLDIESKDRAVLELLLSACEGSKIWDDAVDVAGRLAKFLPDDGKIFMARYLSLVAQEELRDDMEGAKKKFRKALSYDPSCQAAQLHLGDIYFEERNFDKAIELWTSLLRNNPEAIGDLSPRLERAYFEGGQFGKMTEVYEDLSHDLPSNPHVLLGLSRMYQRRGELDAALRLAIEARNLDPRNASTYQALIDLYAERREFEQLIYLLKDYFRQEENSGEGSGLIESRDRSEGRFLWERALRGSTESIRIQRKE